MLYQPEKMIELGFQPYAFLCQGAPRLEILHPQLHKWSTVSRPLPPRLLDAFMLELCQPEGVQDERPSRPWFDMNGACLPSLPRQGSTEHALSGLWKPTYLERLFNGAHP